MRKVLVFGFSSILLLTIQSAYTAPTSFRPFSAVTVSDYLAACTIHQNTCISEVGTALLNKIEFDAPSQICLPSVDYAAAVPKWLSNHPETSEMPTEDGIYLALKTLYPCS
jgi:hypothetical protein